MTRVGFYIFSGRLWNGFEGDVDKEEKAVSADQGRTE